MRPCPTNGAAARAGGRVRRPVLAALGPLLLLLGLVGCRPAVAAGPRLSLPEHAHDFGQLSSNQRVEYRFAFTNAGDRPLEIADVRLEPTDAGAAAVGPDG